MCSCLQRSQVSELMHFLLWELSLSFYIFHRHRVCLVDHVDLICSLYNWWECLGFSSLATLPLGFNCGLISISGCGSSTGFQLWSYFRPSLHVGHPLHVGRPLLRLPWRTLICPSECQVWRWCSCRGSGSTSYWGELVARAPGNTVL